MNLLTGKAYVLHLVSHRNQMDTRTLSSSHMKVILCSTADLLNLTSTIFHWGSSQISVNSQNPWATGSIFLCFMGVKLDWIDRFPLIHFTHDFVQNAEQSRSEFMVRGCEQQAFFTDGILTCNSKKSAGVNNKINGGWVTFSCSGLRVLVSLWHCHGLPF